MTFEETLKGDVGRIETEADGRVFSGKMVGAMALGRMNEAGSMRLCEIWASRCTRLEEATEEMMMHMPREGNMAQAFVWKKEYQRPDTMQSITRESGQKKMIKF